MMQGQLTIKYILSLVIKKAASWDFFLYAAVAHLVVEMKLCWQNQLVGILANRGSHMSNIVLSFLRTIIPHSI